MKILSAKQSSYVDHQTMKVQNISSFDLMERAANQLLNAIIANHPNTNQDFYIVCGSGNNGGDGLALGRLLSGRGFKVYISLFSFSNEFSTDNLTNQKLLKKAGISFFLNELHEDLIQSHTIVIDALFGVGLKRPLKGEFAKIVENLNAINCKMRIAIDLPSGLMADFPQENSLAFKADETLCLGAPKLTLFLPENYQFIGEWQLIDIGLDQQTIQKIDSSYFMLNSNSINKLYKPRNKFAHKGDFGRVLLHGGSLGKIGAAVLMTKACLRVGAGLVSVHIPKGGNQILQISVPEAMTIPDSNEDFLTEFNLALKADAQAYGPGMGTNKNTESAFLESLKNNQLGNKIVLDADALNILSKNKKYLNFLPKNTILTPHPLEFESLVGKSSNEYERLELLKTFAKKYKCIVVLKGQHTAIAFPNDEVYFNTTGNSGMATGGSGDILTGIIVGLLAQAYTPTEASLLGVYIHGLAGDLAAGEFSKEAMLPTDTIGMLGRIFKALAQA